MKRYFALVLVLMGCTSAFCQRRTYDIVTYTAPAGWKEEEGAGFISYSRVDGSSWAQLAIYQQTVSSGNVQIDFDKAWKEVIASLRKLTAAPDKAAAETMDGWTVVRGSGTWTYNGAAVASVLTVFSNKKVCVSVLCNVTAQPYLKDYQGLVTSLKLDTKNALGTPATTSNTTASKLAGIWEFYTNETSGSLITGGYFRREYRLNANGTYEFLNKTFSAYNPVIFLGRETGTWIISDNKLTIRPAQGKNEEWSKSASGRNMEWGKLTKTTIRKLETVTYTFELTYLSGMEKTYLRLTSNGATVRDGRASNDDNSSHQFTYTPGTPGKPLVDLPPGRK